MSPGAKKTGPVLLFSALAGACGFLGATLQSATSSNIVSDVPSFSNEESADTPVVVEMELPVVGQDASRLAARLEQLEAGLVELRENQLALSAIVDEPTVAGGNRDEPGLRGAPTRSAVDEVLPPEISPAEEREIEHAQDNAEVDAMEQTLAWEGVDPSWARDAIAAFEDGLARSGMNGVYLLAADCRTSVCRFELDVDESVSPEDGYAQLYRFRPWHGQLLLRFTEDMPHRALLYVAREGYDLPAVTTR